MNSRIINLETSEFEKSKETAICIAKKIVMHIDFYLSNETLTEEEILFLNECKQTILDIIEIHEDKENFNALKDSTIIMGQKEDDDKAKEKFVEDIAKVFEIEDKIYQQITLKIWKRYFSDINKPFRQGDKFHYIVHAGREIINLPGKIGYKKNRNFEGDYISASILSNEDLTMFLNNNVGLILEPNESIISAAAVDACTTLCKIHDELTVLDLGNNTYINSGFNGWMTRNDERLRGIATKIAHPAKIEQETAHINERKRYADDGNVNEVVLDDRTAKVIGIFFRTNGKEINIKDYIHVKKLEALYRVPVRIINTSIYRKQKGQKMYTDSEERKFNEQLQKFSHPENLRFIEKYPCWSRNLILHYYTEVVEGAEYDEETRQKIDEAFDKTLVRTYFVQKQTTSKLKEVESNDYSEFIR